MIRFEESSSTLNTLGQHRLKNQTTGAWGTWQTHPHSYWINSSTGFARGSNTPDYKALLKRGALVPMQPYVRYDIDRHRAQFAFTASDTRKKFNPFEEWNVNCNYVGLPALEPNTLESYVDVGRMKYHVQAAAAKIYSRGWDSLTFLAELRKTASMVLGLARKARRLRELELRKEYLEFRYGWRTLWYDIQDIVKVIKNLDDERERFREKAGHTETFSSPLEVNLVNWVYAGLTLRITGVRTVTIGHRGIVVADIVPPQFGFNPIITAWELVSYSFIVDWLINIAQWLESLSFLLLQEQYVAAGGVSVRIEDTGGTATLIGNGIVSGAISVSGTSSQTGTLLYRLPMTIPSSPLLMLRLDAFKILDLVLIILGLKRK